MAAAVGDTEATLSVVTVVELAHGIERANTVERRTAREGFLNELLREISPEPVTVAIAFRAGRLDGGMQALEGCGSPWVTCSLEPRPWSWATDL